ncbi:E3 ubiquitin-protein ligase WAV3 [Typha latifolia]|uniref:E3 ubiquitin-protein ligase WAV3 n=1 Tax=Typha latifolia TaxID=4733 RepID=UPI003C2F3CC2
MGTGWRRAFCTSIRRDPRSVVDGEKPQRSPSPSPSPSPRSCAKLSFFSGSNPATPRQTSTAPGLRCRTKSAAPEPPVAAPAPTSRTPPPVSSTTPKKLPALFQALSTPSSPRSPSRFALLKASLLLSRNKCGICAQSVKNGHGSSAVFTAECSHTFHFPCIAVHVRTQTHGRTLTCPVCSAAWHHAPLLASLHLHEPPSDETPRKQEEKVMVLGERTDNRKPRNGGGGSSRDEAKAEKRNFPNCKAYDDDEPLVASKTSQGVPFNPIPEADEDDSENHDGAYDKMDIFANPKCVTTNSRTTGSGVAVSVMPEAALVSSGRRHGNYVVAIKVKAPPVRARRAPIDLVTVLDVSQGVTGEKLQMLRRAMRLVIASLGPDDRLSMVAFSGAAKRLLPLRRMSRPGQRAARQIIERMVLVSPGPGQRTCVGDALRKATKILEDRRHRNPVATIMLLSDSQQQQQQNQNQQEDNAMNKMDPQPRYATSNLHHPSSATTRFAHLEIPIGEDAHPKAVPVEDAFAKCIGGLVSIVMQDVHLQLAFPFGEISAVYSCSGGQRAVVVGGGGGRGITSVRLGDLYSEEERELLVELRAPLLHTPHHAHSMSVRCSYRDPASHESMSGDEHPLLLPPLHSQSSSLRLRNLFVTTRAVAESRRLVELNDYATALHLLSSARSLLLPSAGGSLSDQDLICTVEAVLADIQRRRNHHHQQQPSLSPSLRRRDVVGGGGGEALTPTSAWRAAEQLAKVAIMRKSMNRVSDLHGFENARF